MLISLNDYVTDSQMNELVAKNTYPDLWGEQNHFNTDWDAVCDDMGQYGLDVSIMLDYIDRLAEKF